MSETPHYEEFQELAWPWSAVMLWGTLVGGWGMGAARGPAAGLLGAAVLSLVVGALASAFLFPLRTRVDREEIEIRFGQYTRFRIPVADIESAEARTYRPLWEYGGWGIRFGRDGIAYSMRGDRGVQLVLRGGRRVLIGSARADELAEAIRSAMSRAGEPEVL